ncbi:hypothetical protein HX92_4042 [Mycobacterium tuberculosis]|nr:hypothetical protein BCGT_1891 [Mycobacterium tuberculosis variant bovis BCG str. ATCC 35743]AKO25101.1 hypothetical protein GS11_2175 [Mycobacterium tuberculosis variant bovis BCG]AOZ43297.1 hypothetical protein BTB1458_2298 [Mycobacterium tuberculosis]EQM21142.1 hypothetical protein GuangZ0019_1833 [Mycobacterium tuberculosis GuangZ0019]EQM22160.1 hypothetical protein FJ05194_1429 [Mycobacterium tuberculosis FJ05194]KAF3415701.1 hypothetical protein BIT18_4270 [Mycobacterium tuberculosis 
MEPSLKYQSGGRDQIDAFLDGVTALATMQERIDEGAIGK